MANPSPRAAYPSDLTDDEWSQISSLVPTPRVRKGETPLDRREVLNAILYNDRTGCQWRYLPHDFPKWKTVSDYFYQWRDDGTFEKIADVLRRKLRELEGRDAEPTLGILDSASRQGTEVGGATGFDAGKKVKGRKWHLLVDVLGLILAVFVTPANVQDRDLVGPVLREVQYTVPTLLNTLVDSAYKGPQVRAASEETGIGVEVVERNKDGPPGFHVIPKRWVVERTHGWLNRERRLSKAYDRNPESTRTWIYVSAMRLMARRLGAAA
jgi:putative transposase